MKSRQLRLIEAVEALLKTHDSLDVILTYLMNSGVCTDNEVQGLRLLYGREVSQR